MKKPGSLRVVRQSTKLTPKGVFEDIPSNISDFDPKGNPVIADLTSSVQLHQPDSSDYHVYFAPLFERERARVIQDRGMTIESIRDEYDLLIVVAHLDAFYGVSVRESQTATATTYGRGLEGLVTQVWFFTKRCGIKT